MSFVNIRGEPIDFPALRAKAGQHRKIVGNRGARKEPTPNGYPAPPGSGPKGKCCKDCAAKATVHAQGGGRSWVKCEANRAHWTRGRGSDILAGSEACSKFQQKESS